MPALNAAIAAIWTRNRAETEAKLHLLESTAARLGAGEPLSETDREEAHRAAHKLAGSAGMFGYMDVTAHARILEQALESNAALQPERIQAAVEALRESLSKAF